MYRMSIRTAFVIAPLSLTAPAIAQEDDNPRVANVTSTLDAIKHHGEAMGVWPGVARDTSWTSPNHYQGIARSPGVGTPYFYISQSGDQGGTGDPASLLIVEMASRNHFGERLRSNRLEFQVDTVDTDPPAEDVGVDRIDFNSGDLNFAHAGGLSVIGHVLAVPLENPRPGNPNPTAVAFYDITQPRFPRHLSTLLMPWSNAGAVAVTRLESGQYLLLTGGWSAGDVWVAYLSDGTSLRDPGLTWSFAFFFDAAVNDFGNPDFSWPHMIGPCDGHDSYQNLTFVTSVSGALYLIGTTKRGSCGFPTGTGSDVVDLFRVEYTYPSTFRLVSLGGKHLYCSWANAGQNGNLVAGGGVHITPSGQILIYASNHANSQPPPSFQAGDPLFMTEFRTREMIQAGTCGPSTIAIELYDDDDGWDGGDRSLVYDYDDRGRERWSNLGFVDDFNDRTSSMMYCAPLGSLITLCDDTGCAVSVSWPGTGRYEYVSGITGLGTSRLTITTPNLSDTIYAQPWCGATCVRRGDAGAPMGGVNEALSVWADASRNLMLRGGNYDERCVIEQPMVIRAEGVGGTPVIGRP